MRIDLQSARVRPVGTSGIAHRTASGILLLTSQDGRSILATVEGHSREPSLVEHVIREIRQSGPSCVALLFLSRGELHLLSYGTAVVSASSATSITTIVPRAGQVSLRKIDVRHDEAEPSVCLAVGASSVLDELDQDNLIDLQAGTVLASSLQVYLSATSASEAAVVPAAVGIRPASATGRPKIDAPFIPSPAFAGIQGSYVADEAAGPTVAAEATTADSTAEPTPQWDEDHRESESPDELAYQTTATAPKAFSQEVGETSHASDGVHPVDALTSAPSAAANGWPTPAPSTQSPAPVATSASRFLGSEPHQTVTVLGIACTNGHHNHPNALHCFECGVSITSAQRSVYLNGQRPPLGLLVADDGSTFSLASDLVIGREPAVDNEVAAGKARGVALSDDSLSLSRRHAKLLLDEWDVLVCDLGSSNGTFVNRDPATESWEPVSTSRPQSLSSGNRIRVGGRILRVELHHHP